MKIPDFKIMIPITKIYRYWKNRKGPSVEEKIKRETDKIKYYRTKCCNTSVFFENSAKTASGYCSICNRSWRGVKEIK